MFTLILFFTIIVVLTIIQWRKIQNFPPGPIPFPIIGNLPQLLYETLTRGGIVKALEHWKRVYGPVFTIWLGPLPTVHICDLNLATEAMVMKGASFMDRWMPLILDTPRNGRGLIGSNGPEWLEQRRFSLHTLRNFGLGRNIMEERIMMEFDDRTDALDAQLEDNEIVDAKTFFGLMVGSIINRLLFSYSFDKETEEEFFNVKHKMEDMIEKFSIFDINAKKWFFDVPFLNRRYKGMVEKLMAVKSFISKQVENRRNEIENGHHLINGEGEDYADAYFLKMYSTKEPETTFDEEGLTVSVMDLWIAGQETTTTTLIWGCIFLLNHPEVMEKVREELLHVTKQQRSLSLQNKSETPYLNATIMEIQRHASLLNLNFMRQTTEDQTVGGHLIKKGTLVAAELSLIMNDPQYFKNREDFDPSRFLAGDKLDQHVVPFGLGRRSCLGESLARAELYLILGNLLLRYRLSPVNGRPSMETVTPNGPINRPSSLQMRMARIKP